MRSHQVLCRLPVTSTFGALCMVLCGCGDDCRNLDGVHRACGPSSSRLPISATDGSFAVMGSVNGRKAQLVVDTGAAATVVSSALLGLSDQTPFSIERLCLGDFCVEGGIGYAWETPFSAISPELPQGFVGMDVLQSLTLRFEWGQTATLGDRVDACSGIRIDFAMSESMTPILDGSIDAIELPDVTLDTGATRTVLDQATADSMDAYFDQQAIWTSNCTIQGCTENSAKLSRAKRVCVGEMCVEDLEIKYPVWNAIGANWVARHDLLIDFPRRRMTFCDR